MMLLTCPTPHALLLCAVADGHGVLRCPSEPFTPPGAAGPLPCGLALAVAPLLPINPQLAARAEAFFARPLGPTLRIEQAFADPVADGAATLYLATIADAAVVADSAWLSLPQILRQLEGRARIPYLRAWQILAGGLHLNTKAVEASEVAKYFSDESSDS